ncbi:7855_t:CDS:2 [Dentiscutata erythropus]|uniref:7855_t:CDS:1 n=1 Tax=Dentiscutata erythropus TaxID=1348616 RepID=A0A9N8ZQK6_9GLOM|nr:7855_t:CDS:2 [Dentiscutata erythropus]
MTKKNAKDTKLDDDEDMKLDDKNDKLDDKNTKLDDKNDKLDDKDTKLDDKKNHDNNNIKKILLGYLREFPQGKFNGSLEDNNLLDKMIKLSTELSDAQKVEYQKIRISINDIYKDEECDHYFVDLDDLEYKSVFLDTSKASFEDVEQLVAKLATDDIKVLLNSTRDFVKDDVELLKRIDDKLNKKRKPLKVSNSEFKKLIKQFRIGVVVTINKPGLLEAIDSVISCYKELVKTNEDELNDIKKLVIEQFYKQPDLTGMGAFFRFASEGDFKYKISLDPLNKHQFVYVIYRILVERELGELCEENELLRKRNEHLQNYQNQVSEILA